MSDIIQFYKGKPTDQCRHTLVDIWTFSFDRMENSHDSIQWLFPLDEPSAHNPNAPILTKEDILEFRNDPKLRWCLMTSVHIFMRFIHFRTLDWLTEFDHNHLRITRMLKCLMLMGMELEARALLSELMLIVEFVPEMSKALGFWKEAIDQ